MKRFLATVFCLVWSAAGASAQTDPASPPPDEALESQDRSMPTSRDEEVVRTLGEVIGDPELQHPNEDHLRRLAWSHDRPRFGFDEAVLTLGLGALLVAAELLPTASFQPNWRGGILFDDGAREGLRLRGGHERSAALVASDVLMWTLVAFPFVVDAFGVTGIANWSWDSALQMGLIALESYVLALIVWRVTVLLTRRERPTDSACGMPGEPSYCRDRQSTQSFFSNQTVNAFTGASLTCLQHSHMPIFGGGAADTTACIGAMTLATTVGLMRVMSDFEYLSDVLVGAVVGFVAGYVVPWILHYQGGQRPELTPPADADEETSVNASNQNLRAVPVPMLGAGDSYGLSVIGVF